MKKIIIIFSMMFFIGINYAYADNILIVLGKGWKKHPYHDNIKQNLIEKYIDNSNNLLYNIVMMEKPLKRIFTKEYKEKYSDIYYINLVKKAIYKEKEVYIPFILNKGVVKARYELNFINKGKKFDRTLIYNLEKYTKLLKDKDLGYTEKIKLEKKIINKLVNDISQILNKEVENG